MNSRKSNLCKCHPDFHMPEGVVLGKDFDGAAYAERARASGADSLVFFAKCHYGFSYYPTTIGTLHPGLQKDMLGEFVKGCREKDIGVTGYYSVFLDTAAVKKNPHWLLQSDKRPFNELIENVKFLPVCVNSGYLDELLIPQTLEILEHYNVDEMFYDTMAEFIPCYCDNCRNLFGRPIPENSENPDWLDYVRWYYMQYEAFFAKIARVIFEYKPEVSATFNWEWSAVKPDKPVPHVRRLAGDLFTSGSVSSYYSHYWAGTGYPFDYMCGRFLHGLGDWSNNTPETLKFTCASAIANGGGFYLIDRQLPDGSMEDRAYGMMKEVFGFIQERRDVVEDTVHVPETAILHPFEHIMGPQIQYFPDKEARKTRMRQLKGASSIFMTHGRHYTAVNTGTLNSRLPEYRLLILPEVEYLSQDTKACIKTFVENGGKLFIVQSENEAGIDRDILDLAGVEYRGRISSGYSYMEHSLNGIPDPIMVRGHVTLVEPKEDVKILAKLILPQTAGMEGKEFGHGFAPPVGTCGQGAIFSRSLGKGEIIYAAGPLFTSYETFMNPHISKLVLELCDLLLPAPLVRVHAPAQVEMTAVKKGDDLIVHLVNHSGKEVLADWWLPVTEFIPELYGIKVSVRCSGKGCSIISAPDGETMETVSEEGYMCFEVPSLKIMRSLRLNGYFA